MQNRFLHLIVLAAVVIACGVAFVACSSPHESSSGKAADDGARANDSFESTAMVVRYGDGEMLFFDQENDAPYSAGLDNAEIVGIDRSSIHPDDLVSGNVVRVTGNGIMLESYPGQYPGIARVEVVEEGSPDDAARYDDVIAQIWQPRDPAEPAHATVEYATDLAVVALMPLTCGYDWSYENDGVSNAISVDAPTPLQYAASDLPDARIDSPVDARVSFDIAPIGVEIVRWDESAVENAAHVAGSEQGIDESDVVSEPVETMISDGGASFALEPGWRYAIIARFEQGSVTYAFLALQPR